MWLNTRGPVSYTLALLTTELAAEWPYEWKAVASKRENLPEDTCIKPTGRAKSSMRRKLRCIFAYSEWHKVSQRIHTQGFSSFRSLYSKALLFTTKFYVTYTAQVMSTEQKILWLAFLWSLLGLSERHVLFQKVSQTREVKAWGILHPTFTQIFTSWCIRW